MFTASLLINAKLICLARPISCGDVRPSGNWSRRDLDDQQNIGGVIGQQDSSLSVFCILSAGSFPPALAGNHDLCLVCWSGGPAVSILTHCNAAASNRLYGRSPLNFSRPLNFVILS